jgi:hypothetical protein
VWRRWGGGGGEVGRDLHRALSAGIVGPSPRAHPAMRLAECAIPWRPPGRHRGSCSRRRRNPARGQAPNGSAAPPARCARARRGQCAPQGRPGLGACRRRRARSRLRPSPARSRLRPSPARGRLRPSPARSRLRPSPARGRLRPSPARSRLRPSPARGRPRPSPGRRPGKARRGRRVRVAGAAGSSAGGVTEAAGATAVWVAAGRSPTRPVLPRRT